GGGLPALAEAMTSIDVAGIEPARRMRVTAQVLDTALAEVRRSGAQPAVRIGSWPATEAGLRDGLERAYRALAGSATVEAERHALVDAANAVRRWTLL
ncbi:MAG TPA: tetratricopeptide repeat protein, partial [Actinotalea sp.]|nr:tetratricopeptide repeat protein [Actinotalea sp.]